VEDSGDHATASLEARGPRACSIHASGEAGLEFSGVMAPENSAATTADLSNT
jgi:hypothetical protein